MTVRGTQEERDPILAEALSAARADTKGTRRLRWESWLESLADAYHVERERADKAEEALRLIASCESHHPDDVVAIARAALAARPSQATPDRPANVTEAWAANKRNVRADAGGD